MSLIQHYNFQVWISKHHVDPGVQSSWYQRRIHTAHTDMDKTRPYYKANVTSPQIDTTLDQ